jgi:hypothetical protein
MIFTRTMLWEGGAEKEARTRREGIEPSNFCVLV